MAWWCAVIVIMAAGSGCAGNRFNARTLPRQFHAMPTTNAKTIDLTRLASATLRNDLINNGDVIEVHISAGLSADDTIEVVSRVNDRGEASLPHVGDVALEGLELEEAEAVISTACIERGLYRAPHVTVTMKRPKVNRVTVVGAVEEQGTYELRSGQTDLLAALVAAGGLAEDAGTIVEIRHPGYRKSRRSPAPPPIADEGAPGTGHALTSHDAATEPAGTSAAPASAEALRVDLTSLTTVSEGNRLQLDDGTVIMVERR
ncbi:MAG: polysaccharide biosynthesis/export family protein, partial [Maioricimonas sp. JB049]